MSNVQPRSENRLGPVFLLCWCLGSPAPAAADALFQAAQGGRSASFGSVGSPQASSPAQGALRDYVGRPDSQFEWQTLAEREEQGFRVTHLKLVSQQWREHVWSHHLQVVRPAEVRHPDIAFLFVTGNGTGRGMLEVLRVLAERGGAVAAVVTQVPNQPLYDGRSEDALIAYTFDQYARTGDRTWPLLLPMVKSAVRAMDAVVQFEAQRDQQTIERVVVGGASKRGWTTWLTGAVDARVAAIAPMVIDMLNMKQQLEWAEKLYGRQSEKIHDYTDLSLHLRMDEPRIKELRQMIDPYHYRERYTMPKLILLGTNDRYWTVDSLRHYWPDLPGPKLIYQTPNAGHDLGGGENATQTLAAFFHMIASGQPLPEVTWQFQADADNAVRLKVHSNVQARAIWLWSADSADRDFRDATWTSRELESRAGSSQAEATVEPPATGYRAFLVELRFADGSGHEYRFSTEARVTPDTTL